MSGSQCVRYVMPRWPALSPLRLLLLLVGAAGGTSAYFADWGVLGGRPQEPTCVDIPENMALCSGIDYSKMRLPNLLEHDTLKEAQQQAGYWVPLLNLQCHPNTQLFLCSLFTPVCLESPIYPCRSLCEAVRSGCESRMQTYSFPWPEMLNCEKFPLDNDMCITVQHTGAAGPGGDCPVCNPVDTYENILDNYCRADLVVKTRVKSQRKSRLLVKKPRVYKSRAMEDDRRAMRRLRFSLTEEANCCSIAPSRKPFLIMGRRQGTAIIPTFVMPYKKSKPLRQALKMFRRGLNCSDPNLITNNLETPSLSQEPPRPQQPNSDRRRGGRKNCQKTCRRTCGRRCRKNRNQGCSKNCRKNCRKNCNQGRNSRGRNRKTGRRQNHPATTNHRQPLDVLPAGDITSDIASFAPSHIEGPQSNDEILQPTEEEILDGFQETGPQETPNYDEGEVASSN
ncbi:secreted frizzled-related protein 5-like isoform X2 [Panulirus ornatus]|uniref:secreted frizzled-related protein 5-like isoform X2 n=1 Tax=Panulirus ornatus TaxID=150431 RepID=UPI003A86CC2E